MLKNVFVCIACAIATSSYSQSKDVFSYELDTFKNQITLQLQSARKNNNTANSLSIVNHLDKLSEQELKILVDIYNILKKRRYSKEVYIDASVVLSVFLDKDGVSTQKKLEFFKDTLLEKDISTIKKYMSIFINVFFDSKLNTSNLFSWNIDGEMDLVGDKQLIKIHLKEAKLLCKNKVDSFRIDDFDGIFDPIEGKINMSKGKINVVFDNANDTIIAFATKKQDISTSSSYLKIDSVRLSQLEKNKDIFADLELKLRMSKKDNNYPIVTYSNYDSYKNIYNNVDFEGVYKITPNSKMGINHEERKALLNIKRNDSYLFKVKSSSFFFKENSCYSPEASLSIHIGNNDSINYDKVMFIYDLDKGTLYAKQHEDKETKIISINTKHKVDMYLSSVSWKTGSEKIYFLLDKSKTAKYMSNRFFSKSLMSKFKGVEGSDNILKKIGELISEKKTDKFELDYLSRYFEITKAYMLNILKEMYILGYSVFNHLEESVTFTDKFKELLNNSQNPDSNPDKIVFHTEEDHLSSAMLDLRVDSLNMNSLYVKGVSSIDINTEKKTFLYNTDSITIGKDMNMLFDGNVNVGNFILEGKLFNFNYEEFKIFLNATKCNLDLKSNQDDQTVLSKSKLENLSGAVLLDDKSNKSGRKNLAKYPILDSITGARIYYDNKDIHGGIYNREHFYVEIDPFTLDSLTIRSSSDINLSGTFYSKDVFPHFRKKIKPLKDLVIGFEDHKTPKEGYPIYGGKGNFKGNISMDSRGLTGNGESSFYNIKNASRDMLFFPDTLFLNDSKLNISSTEDMASVKSESVDLKWMMRSDSVFIKSLKEFSIFSGELVGQGNMIFKPQRLVANGKYNYKNLKLSSDSILLKKDKFYAYKSTLSFYDRQDDDLLLLKFKDYDIDVSISEKKGYLKIPKDSIIGLFSDRIQFHFDQAIWDTEMSNLYFHNDDNSPSDFIYRPVENDSILFKGESSTFDFKTLKTSGTKSIKIIDSHVYPNEEIVTIDSKGYMEEFKKASLNINDMHEIVDANIKIWSGKKYTGNGTYNYIDRDSIAYPLIFDNIIGLDSMTIAKTMITKDKPLQLSPYFSFSGEISIMGNEKNIEINGSIDIFNECEKNKVLPISIDRTFINKDSIEIVPKNERISGFYLHEKSVKSTLLSRKEIFKKDSLILVSGNLSYNYKKSAYEIRKYKEDKLLAETYYFNDNCSITSSGKVLFYNSNEGLTINSFGTGFYKDKAFNLDLALGLNFFFNKKILEKLYEKFTVAESIDISKEDNLPYKLALNNLLSIEEISEYEKDIEQEELDRTVPENFQHILFLNNLKLKYNKERSEFFPSKKQISISQLDGKFVNKVIPGYVKLKRKIDYWEIEIYMKLSSKEEVYFTYSDSVLEFYSTDSSIMSIFDNLKESDREQKNKSGYLIYSRGNQLRMNSFRDSFSSIED
ncbi:hypothetical protein [Ichthyobacterium seriolicida]|uniref:Uncharacterized protein n=1 Tax=Ichthyobacterium seriolicida TaxID=242600 RepID=A0A1J1E4B2_9FLAO|nr:hypothetical protein [Ichthyobacterium seriolicida]BAV94884.1 hypothetical protein JBKA6_0871 [Ichthyobacterium seriolicida]